MRRLQSLSLLLALGGVATWSLGCELEDTLDAVGVNFDISGSVAYSGDVPANEVTLNFVIYPALGNRSAFDASACPEGTGVDSADQQVPECFGSVELATLTNSVDPSRYTVSASAASGNFTLSSVPVDAAYIIEVIASAPDARCTTDILGLESDTKLVTRQSAITPANSTSSFTSGNVTVPTPANVSCERIDDVDDEDVEPPPDNDDGDLPDPVDPAWTLFTLSNNGNVLADASAGPVAGSDGSPPCGISEPLDLSGAITGSSATEAYIHIQEGSGADAIIRDLVVPLTGGSFSNHKIQLSGGYARIQVDLDPIDTTDFTNASYVIEVCDISDDSFDWPSQELLTVVSWNTNDTDVDTHVWVDDGSSGEDHIWYARKRGTNGELDVDDVDGYGPETITSNAGVSGANYDVQIHYYSDHGNSSPQTDVTVRVIYANEAANVYCDITRVVRNFRDGAWEEIGRFGPSLQNLADQDPARFANLGCRRP